MTKSASDNISSPSPPPIYFPIRARGGAELYVTFENYRFDEVGKGDLISCIMDAEDEVNEMLLRHRGDSIVNERELLFETHGVDIYIEPGSIRGRQRELKWSTALLLLSAIRDFADQPPHFTSFDFDVYNNTLSAGESIAEGYVAPFGDTEGRALPANIATY